ncbi:hypothetical protein OG723_12300 [Streptomyces sp. NBC_01278]|uniref:hypothetical protein n=1 Tax=unclassified Streptomyces TaxID=2593676 RepID=UPI002E110500|nr:MULTISPECIES: hypothetical protein [unclassified Streptomyces]WSR24841.1 hypothetical protein OG573_01025 [Streptomyces sp. NBC_01205]
MTRRPKPLDCAACGATVRRGKYRLCMLGCGARLHTDKRSPCIDAHIPVCDAYQPHPQATGGAMADIDLGLMACAVAVHALRDQQDGLRLILDSLDRDQLQLVALGALAGLGEAVRSTPGAADVAICIALGLQDSIYQNAIEGNQS